MMNFIHSEKRKLNIFVIWFRQLRGSLFKELWEPFNPGLSVTVHHKLGIKEIHVLQRFLLYISYYVFRPVVDVWLDLILGYAANITSVVMSGH